jgi:hypothetical protein
VNFSSAPKSIPECKKVIKPFIDSK